LEQARLGVYCVCMPRSPSPSSPSVALVAARYELVRELRVNSETVDWEAFDTALDRRVVVQLLRPELVHDTAAIERFWQVARAGARRTALDGDRVLDGGTDSQTGQLFVVREWPASPASPPLANAGRRVALREPAGIARLLSRFEGSPRWLVVGGLLAVVILVGAAIRPGVDGWLAWVNEPLGRSGRSFGLGPAAAVPATGAQPGQSTSTPAAAPPTVAAAGRTAPSAPTAVTAIPTVRVTATPAIAGQNRRIVNTDGRGVALRAVAGGTRLPGKGYDEGATVQALEQSGDWTRIRGADGREGWVLSVTLAP
jgi:hypothetical protein